MSNPWDNDPVVQPAAQQPWMNDQIVKAAVEAAKQKPLQKPAPLGDIGTSLVSGISQTLAPVLTAAGGPLGLVGQGMEKLGNEYSPQSVAGDTAKTVGQFLPGAMVGPEGVGARAASVLLPALADEAAGQATKGTVAEPYARTVAALLGAGASGAVSRAPAALVQALKGTAETAPSVVDAVAPTIQQLKANSQNAYNSVFLDPSKNPIISKDALSDLSDQVQQIAIDHGFKPSLNPKAAVVISDISNLPNENSTLAGLESTRRLASNVASDYGTSDGALASKIKAKITDFMSNLDDNDIVGTEANGVGATDLSGVQALNDARANWSTMRKAEIIQKIQDDAEIRGAANYSQAGVDGAIRRGAANLATNTKKMAQFTPDEQDAIKQVATGSLPTNIFRGIGKFAVRGPISGMALNVAGHLLGPAGPYMLAGAAEAAKAGAASGTQADMDALSALIRGGPEAQTALATSKRAALLGGLANFGPAAITAGATMAPQQQ